MNRVQQFLQHMGTPIPPATQLASPVGCQAQAAESFEDSVSAIPSKVADLDAVFASGKTKSLAWRTAQLNSIITLLEENEDMITDAVLKDLGKSKLEGYISEVHMVKEECNRHISNLQSWTKPKRVATPVPQMKGLSVSEIVPLPIGTCLIIGAWNYPIQLVLLPMVGAISAGNPVVVKPSEISAASSAVLATLVRKYLDPEAFAVFTGGVDVATTLLQQKFAKIFYTGNTSVGKIVYKAAAEHLTPVVLELGGKSPCIVDKNIDFNVTVRRITHGRFMNAGQTCVAPDYLLVHEDIHDQLVSALANQITVFYGKNPKESPDLGRVVSENHVNRLSSYLSALNSDAKVVTGGLDKIDKAERYVPPTLITNVSPDSLIMKEEIFGPLLPILKVKSIEAAISFVNARPQPLAAYIFSKDSSTIANVRDNVLCGGMCANETIHHLTVPSLPFGGVGPSGIGDYHGKASFDAFSHKKSFLNKTTWFDVDLRYPPYTEQKQATLRKVL